MTTIASMTKVLLCAGFLGGVSLHAYAAPAPAPEGAAQDAASSGTPKGFECHGEPLTGSGPGFKNSQGESEEVAVADWLEKAHAVYPDATWEAAKDSFIQCVKQGLYSKCFATGTPCRPKPE
jgi:GH24 family phage-related lysozyme (muramidase)